MNFSTEIGEVWANMLHNVYAGLVVAKGFSDNARKDPSGKEGNVIFLHLFIDALALQPCNPTFVTARECSANMFTLPFVMLLSGNAWIQADVNRYKGANRCTL
jgi:extracellular elastinolytic metalloproteinase